MLPLLFLLVSLQDAELAETVITAPRAADTVTTTPARVTKVTGDQLRNTGERSLPRALGQIAGIWIQETNMGGGAPVMRGFLGNKVLILVDGVRINDSTTRLGPNQSLNQIDPEIVDRVEVIRGPSSVLYGSDAIGGVISIWTKRRQSATQDTTEYLRPWAGEATGLYDTSYVSGRASLRLDGAWQNHGALGIASGWDYNDFRAGDGEVVENTGYNGFALFGSYEYALDKRSTLRFTGRANVDYDVPRTDRLNPGFGQSEPAAMDWRYTLQDRRGYALAYTDEHPGAVADRLQLRLNLHRYKEERYIRNQAGTELTFSRDDTVTLGVGMDWQRALSEDHLFTWGLDASFDDVDSTRELTDAGGTSEVAGNFAPNAEYRRYGLFVQDEVFAFDPWFVTAGLRFSIFDWSFGSFQSNARSSNFDSALTGSVEIAREIGEGTTLFASIAQGFRAPGLDDLANDGDFAGGTEIANPNLDAETSLSVEAGLAYARAERSGTLTAFATRLENAIGRRLIDIGDPGQTGDETFLRENTGEVEIVGIEAAYRQRLGDEDSAYSADGRLTWTYGREDDPAFGGSVPARRIPPLFGTLGLNYEPQEREWFYVPNGRVFLDWATAQSRLHPEDIADPRIDPDGTSGWLTYNLEVWGDFDPNASWRVGLLNLTDERYRVHGSGIDSPGRRLVISVVVRF